MKPRQCYETMRERLMSMVRFVTDEQGREHWLWLGRVNNRGYPTLNIYSCGRAEGSRAMSRPHYAHRVSFEAFKRPLRPGEVPDHTCCTPLCINPDCLEAVTIGENNRRTWARGRR